MINKLTSDEVNIRRTADGYVEVDKLEQFKDLDDVSESGFVAFDKDNNVTNMYKFDSCDETINTMKKVVAVTELGDDEISKYDKVRHIFKVFFDICFKKKSSVFFFAMMCAFMFGIGIKEKAWFMCVMYTWGFWATTDSKDALNYVKKSIEEYKLREEAILDNNVMDMMAEVLDNDLKLYMVKNKK